MTLSDVLIRERSAILAHCERRISRYGGALSITPPKQGWTIFYDSLVEMFANSDGSSYKAVRRPFAMSESPMQEYANLGYTVTDVVHSFRIMADAIAELIDSSDEQVSQEDRTRLADALDAALAQGINSVESAVNHETVLKETQKLGVLAHELRNSLQSATIALELIESGAVGSQSNTSKLLQKSLDQMRVLIDNALASIRLQNEPDAILVSVQVHELIEEVTITANYQAKLRSITLEIQGRGGLCAKADRSLVVSALANVLQNAIKFTPIGGKVQVRSFAGKSGQIHVEVQDECGGLSSAAEASMFEPFTQFSSDLSGVGLGLSIVRTAIARCHGQVYVRNADKGCVFTIELPCAA